MYILNHIKMIKYLNIDRLRMGYNKINRNGCVHVNKVLHILCKSRTNPSIQSYVYTHFYSLNPKIWTCLAKYIDSSD